MADEFDPRALIEDPTQTGVVPGAGFDERALIPGSEQVAAEVFRANFDPDNFASTKLRVSLARGDNLAEKRLRVRKFFPKGDVRVLQKSIVTGLEDDVLLFRESPQQQWKLVEPPGFDFTDVLEAVAPSAESIAVETGVALATVGGSIPATVGRQALGAFAGESIEQFFQSLRGVQAQTTAEILLEPTIEGGFSALGGFGMSPFVATGNVLAGRGSLQVGEEGLSVIRAAKRIDPDLSKKLTPALVTDNPALRLSERQSAALLPGLQRRYRDLIHILDDAIKENVDQKAFGKLTDRVSKSFKNLSETFLKRIGIIDTAASKGGKALQQGIEEYDLVARRIVDDLYKAARRIEEPIHDLDSIINLGQNLRAGVKGRISPEVDDLLKQIEAIDGPITTPDGTVVSVTDQLRNVRTVAYDLKNVPPGGIGHQPTGQTNDLFKAINDVLNNPTNTNAAFRTAWKKANNAASERFTTLEKAAVIKAAKSQNPAELIDQFARPRQVGNLQTLRDAMSFDRFREFTDAFVVDVFDDPAQALARLDAFDDETLDVLLPRAEQASLKKIAKELSRVADVGVDDVIERQIRNKNVIGEIIDNATPRRVSTIMRAANETNDKAMRDSIRAGVFDWTWDGILKQGKDIQINQPLLQSRIAQLKKSGMWSFLPRADRVLLADAEIVARSFRRVIDAGTAIQAAEAVKGVSTFEAGAIRSFIKAGVISHLYLSDTGRRILIGSGLPNSRGRALRLIGGAAAQISRSEDLEQLLEEQGAQ